MSRKKKWKKCSLTSAAAESSVDHEKDNSECRNVLESLQNGFGASLPNEVIRDTAVELDFDTILCVTRLSELIAVPEEPCRESNAFVVRNCSVEALGSDEKSEESSDLSETRSNFASLITAEEISEEYSEEEIIANILDLFPDVTAENVKFALESLGDSDSVVSLLLSKCDSADEIANFPEEVRNLAELCPLLDVSLLMDIYFENGSNIDQVLQCLLPEEADTNTFAPRHQPDLAGRLKLQELYRLFPSASKELVGTVISQCDWKYIDAHSALKEMLPDEARTASDMLPPMVRPSSSVSDDRIWSVMKFTSAQSALDAIYQGASDLNVLQNLARLQQDYVRKRDQRVDICHRRSMAYNNGHRAHASLLAERARQVTVELQEARELICIGILAKHNPMLPQLQRIDLHELQVQEALTLLKDMFRRVQRSFPNVRRTVSIVVGVGRHSKNTFESKLAPAVVQFLETKNIRFVKPRAGELLAYLESIAL